jgi:hypothetical protein
MAFARGAALCLALAVVLATPSWARTSGQSGNEVNGRNVTSVVASTALYVLLPLGRWVETGADGATFDFVEDNRDEWSIYLSDASRGVRLQLDLSKKQGFYSEGSSKKRPLYAITSVSAIRAN